MDPTLTIALILSIGWALSYRWKWKLAERRAAHLESSRDHLSRLLDAQEQETDKLWDRLEHTERLWKDAKRLYLDSLDEIAALRDGSAAE